MKFFSQNKYKKGFTLIELLVVISIVGLLSAITVSSVAAARLKSRDAFIKQQVNQFRNLMQQEFTDNGSYVNLQIDGGSTAGGWFSVNRDCNLAFNGNYAAQARLICKAIIANSAANFSGANQYMWIGNYLGDQSQFSIMAYLPGKQTFYCVGSSGRNSDTADATTMAGGWNADGCYGRP